MTGDNCPTCGRPFGNLDAGGSVSTRHPRTSHTAATISRTSERARVIETLARMHTATADDIASAMTVSPNQIGARLKELRDGGYVAWVTRSSTGKRCTRATRTGSFAGVQCLTLAGWAVAKQLARID